MCCFICTISFILRTTLSIRTAHVPILQMGKQTQRGKFTPPRAHWEKAVQLGFITKDHLTNGPLQLLALLHFRCCLKPSKYIVLFNSDNSNSLTHPYLCSIIQTTPWVSVTAQQCGRKYKGAENGLCSQGGDEREVSYL